MFTDNDKHVRHKWRKKITLTIGWAIALGVIGALAYFAITTPRIPTSEFESTTGLHYHAHLVIIVNGKEQTLPAGLGLTGPVESPIHVHESDNIIHMEFNGSVKKDNLRLEKFFALWGKEWTATSFMGMLLSDGHMLTMKVNGVSSTEYGHLQMRDKQEIEISYK